MSGWRSRNAIATAPRAVAHIARPHRRRSRKLRDCTAGGRAESRDRPICRQESIYIFDMYVYMIYVGGGRAIARPHLHTPVLNIHYKNHNMGHLRSAVAQFARPPRERSRKSRDRPVSGRANRATAPREVAQIARPLRRRSRRVARPPHVGKNPCIYLICMYT